MKVLVFSLVCSVLGVLRMFRPFCQPWQSCVRCSVLVSVEIPLSFRLSASITRTLALEIWWWSPLPGFISARERSDDFLWLQRTLGGPSLKREAAPQRFGVTPLEKMPCNSWTKYGFCEVTPYLGRLASRTRPVQAVVPVPIGAQVVAWSRLDSKSRVCRSPNTFLRNLIWARKIFC